MNQAMQRTRGLAWQQPRAPRVRAALQFRADYLGVGNKRHRFPRVTCAIPFDSPSDDDSSDDPTWWSKRNELRFEWKWYESRGHPGSWNKGMAADGIRGSFRNESSEFRDGSKGPNPPKDSVDKNTTKGGQGISKKDSGFFPQEPSSHEEMGIDLLQSGMPYRSSLPQVCILIFRERMEVFSLNSYDQVTGEDEETVICFEDGEDALRYSERLQDTMPFLTTVDKAQTEDLVDFCQKHGHSCRIQPTGSTLTPPTGTEISSADQEKWMRWMREYYDEDQGEVASAANKSVHSTDDSLERMEQFKNDIGMEIDEARAMLERMIPKDDN